MTQHLITPVRVEFKKDHHAMYSQSFLDWTASLVVASLREHIHAVVAPDVAAGVETLKADVVAHFFSLDYRKLCYRPEDFTLIYSCAEIKDGRVFVGNDCTRYSPFSKA